MMPLIDKILKATKDLKEDDAMLMKWEMIKEFVENNRMTPKNRREVMEAAIGYSEAYGEIDAYCRKYLRDYDCKRCPIYEREGDRCYENPLNLYYEVKNGVIDSVDGHKRKRQLLNSIDEVIEYLKKVKHERLET